MLTLVSIKRKKTVNQIVMVILVYIQNDRLYMKRYEIGITELCKSKKKKNVSAEVLSKRRQCTQNNQLLIVM